ncbi:MAG TPA: hypothetical protein VH643_22660 [Gemmataceae bacterium]
MAPEEFKSWYDFGTQPPSKPRDSEKLPTEPNRPPLANGEGYDVDILTAILDN